MSTHNRVDQFRSADRIVGMYMGVLQGDVLSIHLSLSLALSLSHSPSCLHIEHASTYSASPPPFVCCMQAKKVLPIYSIRVTPSHIFRVEGQYICYLRSFYASAELIASPIPHQTSGVARKRCWHRSRHCRGVPSRHGVVSEREAIGPPNTGGGMVPPPPKKSTGNLPLLPPPACGEGDTKTIR